jgi:hypothetical protein
LAVINSIRRRGVLLLLASLPDGSRSLIPAAWTDWRLKEALPTSIDDLPHTLGRVSDLLQARTIIDALLDRLTESARQTHPGINRPVHGISSIREPARQRSRFSHV